MHAGEISAVLAAITWAVGSLLMGRIGRSVSPGAMNLGKLFIGGGLLAVTYVVLGGSLSTASVPPGAAALLLASSVIGLTIGDTAYYEAIRTLGVPRSILLLSSAPVFAAVGGWIWLGERLAPRSIAGIAVTLGGIALVVVARPNATQKHARPSASARGIACGVVAGVSQAGGSLLSRRAMQHGVDPLAAAALRLLAGGAVLFLFALVIGRAATWGRELVRDRAWQRVGFATLIGTYAGVWLAQVALMRASSTGVASTLLATSPAFALPLAHVAGVERVTLRAALGVVVTVGGIALLSIR